jgi:hypothetical protein
MARKRIAEKTPVVSSEGAAVAPAAASPAPAKASTEKARAPRASANAVTHRHKKNATSESPKPASATAEEAAAGTGISTSPEPVMPTSAETVAPVQPPTHDEIAIRAHLIAESRGFQGGSPEEDWFVAERQLWAERTA